MIEASGRVRAAVFLAIGRGLVVAMGWWNAVPAYAGDDTVTYGSSLTAPVFEQVDARGVDLVHGSLRVATPIMELRQDQYRVQRGLLWTGESWSIVGQPSVWRDGSKYIVMYRGRSEEFNDRTKSYRGRRPVMGGKFGCTVSDPGNYASECVYTDRDGDVVHFEGRPSVFAPSADAYGPSAYFLGNLGMFRATVISASRAHGAFGKSMFDGFAVESYYNVRVVKLALGTQSLTITTPNLDGNGKDDHYLRPKDTVQSVTDANGGTWRYTINSKRRMTQIEPPGGVGSMTIIYDGDRKVHYVSTAAGTWTYDYSEQSGTYGVTTVTDPMGGRTKVGYHHEGGFVTDTWTRYDAATRQYGEHTHYIYDDDWRMRRVEFPEGNADEFDYDDRGNIVERRRYPKPGSHDSTPVDVSTTKASYPKTCVDWLVCNQPVAVTDESGNVTEFSYAQPGTRSITVNLASTVRWVSYPYGPNGPIKIVLPAVGSEAIRPEVNIAYSEGFISKKTVCRTRSPCIGTSDAVVTSYEFKDGYVAGKVETADGTSLRTCYGYDVNGRRISETPPLAGLSECPGGLSAAAVVTPAAGTPPLAPVWPDNSSTTPPPNSGDPDPGSIPLDAGAR